jgi:release factor glutamine methyltransferase
MRPAQLVRRAGTYLDRHGVDSPIPTAELLLAGTLGTDRAGLYARTQDVSPGEAKSFGRALCLRCAGTPVQHITGEQAFRHLVLTVRPGVFIPRPETELVAEKGLVLIEGIPRPVVVDVGTGSGAIALSIGYEHPGATLWATDLSPDAVALASENARRAAIALTVIECDLLAGLPGDLRGGVDLIVSNPPYLDATERDALAPEVLADPPLALFGDLSLYRRLASEATSWLRPGGALVVEIGETQGADTAAVLRDTGFIDVEVAPDLAGRDRMVAGRWP